MSAEEKGEVEANKSQSDGKVVIVAVDEAQVLQRLKKKQSASYFLCFFLRALNIANAKIRQDYGPGACIFAIFVASNPKIGLPDPSLVRENAELFPPFALTEPLDVYHTHQQLQSGMPRLEFYRSLVTEASVDNAWKGLVKLGRSLWQSLGLEKQDLIAFAATTLLSGKSALDWKSLNEQTMFGVVSVLCRLNIAPRPSSHRAPLLVSNFMAVSSHVKSTPDGDEYHTSYSSDPILTFGASHIWYEMFPDCLSDCILPEFRNLVLQDELVTGEMSLVVACLDLLLAMDACKSAVTPENKNRVFSGEFYTVSTFLRVLEGPNIELQWHKPYNDNHENGLNAIRQTIPAKWKDWFVGFSHFVRIQCEPTEQCLWSMLARRAAGIFPDTKHRANLLIPIFNSNINQVGMILVKVKLECDGDSDKFPVSVSDQLDPKYVFPEESPLHTMPHTAEIRVYMNPKKDLPNRFYWIDSINASEDKQVELETVTIEEGEFGMTSNMLCLVGVGEWQEKGMTL